MSAKQREDKGWVVEDGGEEVSIGYHVIGLICSEITFLMTKRPSVLGFANSFAEINEIILNCELEATPCDLISSLELAKVTFLSFFLLEVDNEKIFQYNSSILLSRGACSE